ncbi:carboxymuconolactone decarboxylase family protein [Sandaracinus amylolyticus]|uniref:carboxymuconolactone decarboxylase family protein n=1 Tax=Sandaracinus amylolyticus TaxID=927083 RepID=UPI001F36A520|nr:carboxymuconolactone decarboxylase family protein [Sandaracinus amylolyticus]UJR82420.1 Hypothetical protein I5071_44850 [Sandaracinus amylolyticus]
MDQRLAYPRIVPDVYRALGTVSRTLSEGAIEPALRHLLDLRISQINGCSYCVDLHFREALAGGVAARKINAVAAWRETPFFSPRERAALAWAESLTRVDRDGAPDALYDEVARHFDERERAELTFVIATMNAWNRVAIAFRQGAPETP